jgi:hypothetical protein
MQLSTIETAGTEDCHRHRNPTPDFNQAYMRFFEFYSRHREKALEFILNGRSFL